MLQAKIDRGGRAGRRSWTLLIVALLLIAPAAASDGAAAQLPRSELFTFHSDIFVNLHHFLYRWAQAGPGADTDELDSRIRLLDNDVARYQAMGEADREAWDFAATYYRFDMIARDLLFDDENIRINWEGCEAAVGEFTF